MKAVAIDFLRSQRIPAWEWCLLAGGSVLLLVGGGLHYRWDAERAQQESALAEQRVERQRALDAARRPLAMSADERRLQRVVQRLQQPWLPVLRGIENATESPVFLLAMSIDPPSGRIQLDGEVPSFDHALAYVRRLADETALTGVHLSSHEAVTDPSGRSSVNFTVLAYWSRR